MEYSISSQGYLRRARMQLDAGAKEALFYAALELRCGIESRMQEYLAAWEHISNQVKKGWRITELGRNIEKAFRSGDKIIRWAVYDSESKALTVCLYYTPVTSTLRKSGERLGNYLHAMKSSRADNHPYWNGFERELEDVYQRLLVATTGTLLGPPLGNMGTGKFAMNVEIPDGLDPNALLPRIHNWGRAMQVEVDYLDHFPITPGSEAIYWHQPKNQKVAA